MNPDLSWVLNDLIQVPGARHAILVSADGLLLASSSEIGRDDAETVAAAMSSMQSLSRAVAPFIGAQTPGRWRQTLLEYDHGWIFLIAAGTGAYLAAAAAADVDMEAMSFRMQQQVTALGKAMTTPPRQDAGIDVWRRRARSRRSTAGSSGPTSSPAGAACPMRRSSPSSLWSPSHPSGSRPEPEPRGPGDLGPVLGRLSLGGRGGGSPRPAGRCGPAAAERLSGTRSPDAPQGAPCGPAR